MFDIKDLAAMRDGTNNMEERLQRDRFMYIQGQKNYPDMPDSSLSERDRDCYLMGRSSASLQHR